MDALDLCSNITGWTEPLGAVFAAGIVLGTSLTAIIFGGYVRRKLRAARAQHDLRAPLDLKRTDEVKPKRPARSRKSKKKTRKTK